MDNWIINIIILAIILAISIGLHEYAHAWASTKLGDPTPKLQGRLTPNPLAHLDLIGFLLIFIIHFGWGKPVQIDPRYYKNPARDEFLVAMAWPASNILMAICGIVFLKLYAGDLMLLSAQSNLFTVFWFQFVFLNVGLAVFNLIPLPPLDGRKIIKLFKRNAAVKLEYFLGSYPLLLIAFFYLLSMIWVLKYVWIFANAIVNKLMRIVNLLR